MVGEEWMMWLALAAVFAVAEIFTATFFLVWFGVGAAAACVMAFLGVSTPWQWITFIAVSGALVLVTRPFAEKISKKQPTGIGADRYTGRIGIVTEEVDNQSNTGRVRIGKEEWRADSSTGEIIPEGKKVEVTKVSGTHLVVKPLQEVG